jgi:hypothetical protein
MRSVHCKGARSTAFTVEETTSLVRMRDPGATPAERLTWRREDQAVGRAIEEWGKIRGENFSTILTEPEMVTVRPLLTQAANGGWRSTSTA